MQLIRPSRVLGLGIPLTIGWLASAGFKDPTRTTDPRHALPDTLSQTPVFESRKHPSTVISELGNVSRAMILTDERIVLLDGKTLLFINPWTNQLWTAGGEGEGPGEFAGAGLELGLFRGQGAELVVWDPNNGGRLTAFSDTGALLDTRRVDLSGVGFRHWTANMMGVFADGSFAFIDREPPGPGTSDSRQRSPTYVVEVSAEGHSRTITEFLGAEPGTVLFAHRTVVSFDGARVSLVDTDSDEVRILDRSGRTASTLPMPGRRVKVSRAQLEAARAEAQGRYSRGQEITARQLEAMGRSTAGLRLRERDYLHNEIAPPIDRTLFDGNKRLWMRHYPMPGDQRIRWTVWDTEEHEFSLEMRSNYSPMDARGDLVLLRIQDSLDVHRIEMRRMISGYPASAHMPGLGTL